jgi:hypothetical protein
MVVRPVPGQPDTSTFQWLLELDYGGWVPACLVNLFLPFAQVKQVSFLCLDQLDFKSSLSLSFKLIYLKDLKSHVGYEYLS